MLKNKIIGKKIRNIVILLMAIIVMIGAYRYIDRSRAENVIEINALALDNSGYLEEEEIKLEAKQLEDDSYEIQLPEISNDKKINQIIKVSLENIVGDSKEENPEDILEIVENRIYLTKEQIENKQVKIELEYDVKETDTNKLYGKILKYEDTGNGKLVEVKGYLPADAELQVEEVSQEKITEIFGDKKIKVAYDIKILQKVVTEVPADEANPDAEPTQIVETIEINPEEFGEICEVTITDANIAEKSKVYHVKEDNSYEQVNVTGGEEGNVSFEAQSFSVYAVEDDEIIPDEGEETGESPVGYTKIKGWRYYWPDPNNSSNTVYGTYNYFSYNAVPNYLTVTLPSGWGIQVEFIQDNICVDSCSIVGISAAHISNPIKINSCKTTKVYAYKYENGGISHNVPEEAAVITTEQPPQIDVSPSSSNWKNSALSIKITLKDNADNKWDANNSYQYYLSNSDTELSGGDWTDYTSGTAFSYNPEISGLYYLFVKRVVDKKGFETTSNRNCYNDRWGNISKIWTI